MQLGTTIRLRNLYWFNSIRNNEVILWGKFQDWDLCFVVLCEPPDCKLLYKNNIFKFPGEKTYYSATCKMSASSNYLFIWGFQNIR